jgi:hypothetical protein
VAFIENDPPLDPDHPGDQEDGRRYAQDAEIRGPATGPSALGGSASLKMRDPFTTT